MSSDQIDAKYIYEKLGEISVEVKHINYRFSAIERKDEEQDDRLEKHHKRLTFLEQDKEKKNAVAEYIKKMSGRTKAIILVIVPIIGVAGKYLYDTPSPSQQEKSVRS